MNGMLDQILERTVVGSFTNIGYKLRKREYEALPSMDGRTVVVTGATSGLGKASAEAMIELGAQVVVVARNEAKATELGASSYHIGDLSLMADVRRVAKEIAEAHERIDVLVNNAGALFNEREETAEGLERTFALDLLSPYLLTKLLRPLLGEGSRVINVVSGGMYTARLSVANLENTREPYKGAAAYARAERALVILTEIWAEEWKDDGVIVHSMHPGWADTQGLEDSLPVFRKVVGPFLRTAAEGADTIVWLAAAEEPGESSGLFWHDRAPRDTHMSDRTVERPGARQRLLEALATYV